ncbi:MAG: hypothetical protein KBG29_01575 [Pseudomonadales bacterium]|nr:hypothetical protein [Pseudomonadales bacterium]
MRCTRINTRNGPVWRLLADGVTFYGRSIREAVARYQAHSRALRGGAA